MDFEPFLAVDGGGNPRDRVLSRRKAEPDPAGHLGRKPPRITRHGERTIARHKLDRAEYPAEVRPRLEQHDLGTRPGQPDGGNEPARTAADHDRRNAHWSATILSAASRPEAPMMPPPGWVPAPHW